MTNDLEGDSDAAIEEIDHLVNLIDEIEADYDRAWDKGEDFLKSVRKTLKDMKKTIQEREHVTARQATAIENMGNGVRKWHPEFRD